MQCHKCKKQVKVTHAIGGKLICSDCAKAPRTLTLRQTGGGILFNVDRGRYIAYASLEGLAKCGWFLRRKVQRRDDVANIIITFYYLELYNKIACKQCQNPTDFPAGYRTCDLDCA